MDWQVFIKNPMDSGRNDCHSSKLKWLASKNRGTVMANPLEGLTKLHSRLRCVANGKTEVNGIRAQRNGAVRLKDAAKERALPELSAVTVDQGVKSTGGNLSAIKIDSSQTELSDDVEVSVFVLFNRDTDENSPHICRRSGRLASATLTLSELAKLNDDPSVQSIELGETLRSPDPRRNAAVPEDPGTKRHGRLNEGRLRLTGGGGRSLETIGGNVLVGIIDVGGIDFAHEDFMDEAGQQSRIVAIWDQGGEAFDPPHLTITGAKDERSTGYGSEIKAADIALALKEAPKAGLSPHDLAPQSQRSRGSHMTHVASIAAGRTGVCRRAKIAAVLIALPDSDQDRRHSFYDTTRIVDAIAWLFDVAEREKAEAIAINISLGTNGGAHDGSEFVSRWIDRSLAEPGRVVCVSAGNSGQEAPQFDGDVGFWSGRVHASGQIPAAELRRDIEWVVVGNGLEDVSENELEIWYGAEDELAVELFTPAGRKLGPILPGERIENQMLPDRTIVSIYNVLSDPKNGDNRISIYLSPFMGDPIIGITAGTWRVRITGKIIRNGRFHAWIERDDPGGSPVSRQWALPSFFGPGTFIDDSTLNSLACGPRIVGVANYDEARELMNVTSSQGPTRDGRMKPEIAAPGTEIVAANGFDPNVKWVEMTGTSMASPYVTGVAALMLSLNPSLTAAQIGGIIRRTSRPMPGASYAWQSGAGFGVIDPVCCLREAVRIAQPVRDKTPKRKKPEPNKG